jgi:hypothetical protein
VIAEKEKIRVMIGCAASGRRIAVCAACGAQFLPGSRRHATTCSAACLGWLRLKNKGLEEVRSRADPPGALWHRRRRGIAEKDQTESGADGSRPLPNDRIGRHVRGRGDVLFVHMRRRCLGCRNAVAQILLEWLGQGSSARRFPVR